MEKIYQSGKDRASFLISEKDLLMSLDRKYTKEHLEKIIQDLKADGYFDLVYTSRQGEIVYCIQLFDKGRAFPREKNQMKRTLVFRLLCSVGFALLSFILGMILKAVF